MRPLACAGALLAATLLAAVPLAAQDPPASPGYSPAECPDCAAWNAPAAPARLFGDTWYVGTRGLAALLITTSGGHVLIDGGLPESAPLILANVRALGFRVEDIRLILSSHAHYDHAGGIAAIQRAARARVVASARSAAVLRTGFAAADDPQHAIALAFPAAGDVHVIAEGDTVELGGTRLVAHPGGGHAPGSTTWSWRSCDGRRCLDFVYADSQTPVSADAFRFTGTAAVAEFTRSFEILERIPCDVLVTPHPGASQLWERIERGAVEDRDACRRYAESARAALAARLAREAATP